MKTFGHYDCCVVSASSARPKPIFGGVSYFNTQDKLFRSIECMPCSSTIDPQAKAIAEV